MLLGTFFGHFGKLKVFRFLEFFPVSTLQGALGIFFQKNHLKTISQLVWTLSGTFLDTFEITNCFRFFFRIFPSFDPPGCTGHFFSRKNLKTSSKLVWTLLETCLGILNFEKFLHFFEIFRRLYPPGCTGQKISKKSHQNKFGHFWKRFSGFWKFNFFSIFFEIFRLLDPPGCTEQKISIKSPQNMFGHSKERFWTLLKFQIVFDFFFELFQVSTLQGELVNFFYQKNYLGACWKRVWTLLGKILVILRKNKVFQFSLNFSKFRPSRVHWARKNRKNYLEQVWTFFETFFGILKLWNFRFLWIFLESPGFTGHSVFLRKNQSKHSHAMFLGNFSDNFENFKIFLFFKVFSKPRPSRLHWRLFFEEKLLQNRFGKCLDNIRDSFGHFRNIEIFHFFQSFPYSTLQDALGTKFTETITSKQVQNMFDCFWERFLGILKNWKFFQFFGVFPSFDSAGCTGHVFPKKSPQNNFKTCLDTFRNVFGHFWNFKFFSIFFSNFSRFRPSRVHWAIFFSEKYIKTSSKLVWKLLRTFLDTFRNSNFFDFFSIFSKFRPSRAHWTKNFDKITSKHVWTLLVTILDTFEISNCFRFFFELLQVSTLQGELVNFFHQKTTSEHVENVFEHFWERFWSFWIKK